MMDLRIKNLQLKSFSFCVTVYNLGEQTNGILIKSRLYTIKKKLLISKSFFIITSVKVRTILLKRFLKCYLDIILYAFSLDIKNQGVETTIEKFLENILFKRERGININLLHVSNQLIKFFLNDSLTKLTCKKNSYKF